MPAIIVGTFATKLILHGTRILADDRLTFCCFAGALPGRQHVERPWLSWSWTVNPSRSIWDPLIQPVLHPMPEGEDVGESDKEPVSESSGNICKG